jgi:PTH1 family peptidyl-tRNA hydrolase
MASSAYLLPDGWIDQNIVTILRWHRELHIEPMQERSWSHILAGDRKFNDTIMAARRPRQAKTRFGDIHEKPRFSVGARLATIQAGAKLMSSPQPDLPCPSLRLIVGLGNPGRDYAATRHNVGFLILDRLAASLGASFSREKKWQAEVARAGEVILLKPQTFMNLSGESVGAVVSFHRILPSQCLIVFDDKDLPFGRLRIRLGGSAGGHKGMKSIIDHLGTPDVPRLRFGIGAPADARQELTGHVLGNFAPDERAVLEKRLDRAVDAIHYALRSGVDRAMDRFNRGDEPPPATDGSHPTPDPTPRHEKKV